MEWSLYSLEQFHTDTLCQASKCKHDKLCSTQMHTQTWLLYTCVQVQFNNWKAVLADGLQAHLAAMVIDPHPLVTGNNYKQAFQLMQLNIDGLLQRETALSHACLYTQELMRARLTYAALKICFATRYMWSVASISTAFHYYPYHFGNLAPTRKKLTGNHFLIIFLPKKLCRTQRYI